jgi:hypothetical protein
MRFVFQKRKKMSNPCIVIKTPYFFIENIGSKNIDLEEITPYILRYARVCTVLYVRLCRVNPVGGYSITLFLNLYVSPLKATSMYIHRTSNLNVQAIIFLSLKHSISTCLVNSNGKKNRHRNYCTLHVAKNRYV